MGVNRPGERLHGLELGGGGKPLSMPVTGGRQEGA